MHAHAHAHGDADEDEDEDEDATTPALRWHSAVRGVLERLAASCYCRSDTDGRAANARATEAGMGWLKALSTQLFRQERLIEPSRFLQANWVIGLFATLVLYAGAKAPERSHGFVQALVAVTVLTHVGGPLLTAFVERALVPTLFVQGISLFATTIALVLNAIWYCWHATILTSFSYLPGIMFALLVQASLEIHFFGPALLRTLHVRAIGVSLGVVGELALATALARYFLR